MANQIIIDIGAAANDGTGDPLRTAFNFVNENFSNVWNTGLPTSNVSFSGNRILTVNTNGNLVLAPNGTGKVQANVDIVPNISQAHSLGALDRRWNTVYTRDADVSGNLTVSGDIDFAGDVVIDGNLTVNGTTTTINTSNVDIEDKVITIAFGSPNAAAANGAGITVAGANANITYDSGSGSWDFNQNIRTGNNYVSANSLFVGNGNSNWAMNSTTLTAPSGASWFSDKNTLDEYISSATDGFLNFQTYSNVGNLATELHMEHGVIQINIYDGSSVTWTFDQDGTLNTPGNIVPGTSNVFSLGSSTNQWKDLWVSNNTIYINSVPIGLTAGNTLTVNGEAVLSNDSNTSITTTGNIVATNVTATEWVYGNLGVGTQQIQFTDAFNPLGNSVNILLSDGDLVYESTLGSSGGFRPSADNSESLGKDGYRWDTIYGNVINATTFIGDGSQLSNVGGNTGNVGFDNYNIYNTQGGGIIVSNFNYLTEEAETAWIEIPPGNSASELRVVQEQGNVLLVATNQVWTFDSVGNVTIPGSIVGQNTIVIDNRATGNSADINLFSADDITLQARDRTLGSSSEGGDINIFAGDSADDGDSSGGDVTIEAGRGGAGNFDFGGSGGFITLRAGAGGDASTVEGGQSAYGGGALTLSAGSAGSNMGNVDRGSSGGDVSINAGESTGNNSSGGDIRLNTGTGGANALAGTLSINIPESSQGSGGSWIFDGTGKLTAPGSIEIGTGNTGVQLRSNQIGTGFYATIANITNGLPSVVVTLNDVEFVEGDEGTVRITGVVGETEANGFWGWQAIDVDQIQLYTDNTWSTPVDGTTWNAYVSGGLAVSSGYNELDIQGGIVSIISGAGKYWSFNPAGNLVLPQGGTISEGPSPSFLGDAVTITPANGTDADQQLKIYPTFAEGNHLHLTTGNLYNTEMYVGDDNLYVKLANTGDVVINSNDNQGNTAQWTFGTDGVLTLPSIQIPAEGPQGEAESLVGTRRLIGGVNSDYGYSRLLDNNSGSTIAWEATDDNTVSARITFNITYTNSSFTFQAREMLTIDVVQDLAEQQAYFSVSGRMGTNGYAPGVVSASIVGNKIQINIVPDGIYYYGLAVYDAVEFRNPLD